MIPDVFSRMRTTLACQWCRKSKIKCHHNGAPPCQLCRANPGRECVLSTPVLRRKERNAPYPPPTSKARTYHISETSAPERTDKVHTDQQDRRPQKDGSISDAVDGVTTSGERQSQVAPQQVAAPLSLEYALVNVNSELVTRASRIFVKQFPEFGFVHKPTFFEHGLQDEVPSIKLCAILALCSRYLPELSNIFGHFADVVRENIMSYMSQYPGIDAAHALILLSLYEWGEGNGFQAWIYTGMATRLAQGIHSQMKANSKEASSLNFTMQEIVNRTAWACFVLDCILRCGRYGPQGAEIETPDILLPMNEDDFEFGTETAPSSHFLRQLGSEGSSLLIGNDEERWGSQQMLSLIIEGFGIFSTLSTWICRGGRRYPSSQSMESPWKDTSLWNRSMVMVETWRATHSARLVYSRTAGQLQAHILHSQVERFTVLNLLYYVSILFLHREYIPFFPHRVSCPCGPIDPPFLEEPAPPDWWHHSSRELFEAASTLVQLMQDLEIRNVQFQTPFSAFCIFSAAAALAYADTWPYMAPGLENAQEKYQWSFDWLQSASEKWKVAKRWHEMLSELAGIITRLKTEGQNFPHLGREEFQDLHDSMHRLAEPESTTVNALASLSQGDGIEGSHTQPYLRTLNGGEHPASHVPHARDTVRLHEEHGRTSERNETELTAFEDQSGHTDNDIGVDPDFLLAMLSDPSGDWSHVI